MFTFYKAHKMFTYKSDHNLKLYSLYNVVWFKLLKLLSTLQIICCIENSVGIHFKTLIYFYLHMYKY